MGMAYWAVFELFWEGGWLKVQSIYRVLGVHKEKKFNLQKKYNMCNNLISDVGC